MTLLRNNVEKSKNVDIEFVNNTGEVHINVDDEQLRQVLEGENSISITKSSDR